MCIVKWRRTTLVPALLLLSTLTASAQRYEDIGTRAQGMGGAFVAVADDATAVWWNPAGLATGSYFNAIVEHGRTTEPSVPIDPEAARRATSAGFAVAFPALGVSYYRVRVSEMSPGTDSIGSSVQTRQDPGALAGRVRTVAISQFAVTTGQTLSNHIVIGSTAKLIRGGTAAGARTGASGLLDIGDELSLKHEMRGDLDVGVLGVFGGLRLGASIRNLTKPSFGEDADRITLRRKARAGIAFMSRPIGKLDGVTVAADSDITKTATVFGESRRVAGGAEAWLFGRHVGIRGGVGRNTLEGGQTAVSAGLSAAPMTGLFLEASRTWGADRSLRGWSGAVRMSF